MSKKEKNPGDELANVDEFVAAKRELDELRKEHGLAPKEKGLTRLISSFFERRENRKKASVNRKKLLWLTLLTGWFGGHRFYTRQYILALFYLAFFWTGVPVAMAIIDMMVFLPMAPDEEGNILI